MKFKLWASAAMVLVMAWPTAFSSAAAPTGITLSPAVQQISLPGTTATQTVNYSLTNNEPYPVSLNLKTADFNSLSETGGLLFVGTKTNQYGLANWLSLPENNITILPKQKVSLTITIDNRSDLAPGGHYGALLLYLNHGTSPAQTNQVGISPVATALLFVTKVGGATYRLSLSQVKAPHSLFKLPSSITLTFYNAGNTFLTPRGFITITDPKGKLVDKGIINEESNLILPSSSRNYVVPLQNVALSKAIGSYKLRVNFRFDGYNQYRLYQSSLFLATPLFLVIIVAATLVLVFIFWRVYKRFKKPKPSPPSKTARKIEVSEG